MKKSIRHSVSGYRMPLYMQEILVQNYCPYFLRMSIIKEGDGRWQFSYDKDDYEVIKTDSLDTLDKLILLQTIIKIRDGCEEWLIREDSYLIEPDLIYCKNGVSLDRVRLMFYPDYEGTLIGTKLINIIDKLRNRHNKVESDIFEQIKTSIGAGESIRTRQLLERIIMRLKMDEGYRAG